MAEPMSYQQQHALDGLMKVLQRECEEMLWALSNRQLYGEAISHLRTQKAALEALMVADE